jgi:LPXTG-motif cell wall-anchored protein
LTIVRYLIAALLAIVGLIWIGQGLGFIGGSGMSGQPIFALIGAVLVVAGAGLAWTTRRRSAAN